MKLRFYQLRRSLLAIFHRSSKSKRGNQLPVNMNTSFFDILRFQRRKTLPYGVVFFTVITFCFYCFGVQATAQTSNQSGSPDPVVIKAKKEIIRINKLVNTLKKGDQKTAKQYFNQLKRLEPGLKAVKNKTHPSWKEAARAYTALLKRIVAIAKAKPTEQPQTPARPEIIQALKDIERYEGLAKKMQPGDKKIGQQYLNELVKIEKKILAMKDRTHPKWKEAATRYVAVQKRIVNTANAKPKAVSGPPDPIVAEVMQDLKHYEKLADTMPPGDGVTAKKYLGELTAVGQKLKSAQNQRHPDWAEARTRYNAINKKILAIAQKDPNAIDLEGLISSEQATLKRLNRSISSTRNNIQKASLPKFQDTSEIHTWRNSITAFKRQHTKFKNQKHKGVMTVGQRITGLEKLLEEKIAASQKKLAGLGDVNGRVADIEARFKATKVPKALKPPVSAEAAQTYVQTIRKLQTMSKNDVAYIDKIKAAGFAPQNVGSIKHWAGGDRQKRLSDSLNQSIQRMDAKVKSFMRSVAFVEQTDPQDPNHRSNRLLGKGKFEKTIQELKEGLAAIKVAAAFDKALGRTKAPDRKMQFQRSEAAIKTYTQKYRIALDNIRMPKPAMTDKKYITIAKEVLRNPKYKSVNPHERLVINSKLRRKEKKEGDIQSGTVTTTVTVYHYVWDEFQVATAEKVGNEYFIYYSTIKYYHKGASTTPLQRWILSGRFQSSKILKENIHK